MPVAFLCHASEDKPLAEAIARYLLESGVETFFDSWEIRAGDSLRQRIDEGIGRCTHFIVLLTNSSLRKPWVNAELDAAFVRRLKKECRLIPLRSGVSVDELPPLLQPLYSPEIDQTEESLRRLLTDILGLTERPTLGVSSVCVQPRIASNAGLSIGASQLAYFWIDESENGRDKPSWSPAQLRERMKVPDEDLVEIVDELEQLGWLKATRALGGDPLRFVYVRPTPQLFAALDRFVMPWNADDDANRIAAEILNSPGCGFVTSLLADRLDWKPRRINPAVSLLVDRGIVDHSNIIDQTYVFHSLRGNASTRRFVRAI